MSNEERKQERLEKVKKFLRKHKNLLAVLGAGATIIIGGTFYYTIIGKRSKMQLEEFLDILQKNTTEIPRQIIKNVDKDIFTTLAIDIEEAVLDKSRKILVLDRFYDLGDNLHKLVTVSIENVCEN